MQKPLIPIRKCCVTYTVVFIAVALYTLFLWSFFYARQHIFFEDLLNTVYTLKPIRNETHPVVCFVIAFMRNNMLLLLLNFIVVNSVRITILVLFCITTNRLWKHLAQQNKRRQELLIETLVWFILLFMLVFHVKIYNEVYGFIELPEMFF